MIDTAGIRENSTDIIENFGIEKSLEKMRSADIVLYIFDVNTENEESLKIQIDIFEKENIKYLLVANKADKGFEENKFSQKDIRFISAKLNTGIAKLKQTLFTATVHSTTNAENNIVTNARHLDSLKKIAASLHEIKNGLEIGRASCRERVLMPV